MVLRPISARKARRNKQEGKGTRTRRKEDGKEESKTSKATLIHSGPNSQSPGPGGNDWYHNQNDDYPTRPTYLRCAPALPTGRLIGRPAAGRQACQRSAFMTAFRPPITSIARKAPLPVASGKIINDSIDHFITDFPPAGEAGGKKSKKYYITTTPPTA